MTAADGGQRPGAAGAPPALAEWPTSSSPAILREEVSVTLPRWLWINFLAWAHGGDYVPNTIPWVDRLVNEIEEAIDAP